MSEEIMAGPRRLRTLNLDALDADPVGEGHENSEGNGNDESLQGPRDIDGLIARIPHQTTSPIKTIWPNGDVRPIVGDFKVANLLGLQGGKVMVGTDPNGVPNEISIGTEAVAGCRCSIFLDDMEAIFGTTRHPLKTTSLTSRSHTCKEMNEGMKR